MTSTNYVIFADDFNGGSVFSSSTAYKLEGTCPEFGNWGMELITLMGVEACTPDTHLSVDAVASSRNWPMEFSTLAYPKD